MPSGGAKDLEEEGGGVRGWRRAEAGWNWDVAFLIGWPGKASLRR